MEGYITRAFICTDPHHDNAEVTLDDGKKGEGVFVFGGTSHLWTVRPIKYYAISNITPHAIAMMQKKDGIYIRVHCCIYNCGLHEVLNEKGKLKIEPKTKRIYKLSTKDWNALLMDFKKPTGYEIF